MKLFTRLINLNNRHIIYFHNLAFANILNDAKNIPQNRAVVITYHYSSAWFSRIKMLFLRCRNWKESYLPDLSLAGTYTIARHFHHFIYCVKGYYVRPHTKKLGVVRGSQLYKALSKIQVWAVIMTTLASLRYLQGSKFTKIWLSYTVVKVTT